MDKKLLKEKLEKLKKDLIQLETVEAEKIRLKRIEADMEDDYRENEYAKMVMGDHDLLWVRKLELKREIVKLKKMLLT